MSLIAYQLRDLRLAALDLPRPGVRCWLVSCPWAVMQWCVYKGHVDPHKNATSMVSSKAVAELIDRKPIYKGQSPTISSS